MTDVKVEFSIGEMKFSGEGDKEWFSEQLDKILSKVGAIDARPTAPSSPVSVSSAQAELAPVKPLPSFLEDTGSKVSQVRKFLACALWIQMKHGRNRVTTREVTVALREASQSRLGNPADCLRLNVGKGFCEKVGSEFYITEDGRKSILGA